MGELVGSDLERTEMSGAANKGMGGNTLGCVGNLPLEVLRELKPVAVAMFNRELEWKVQGWSSE